MSVADELRELLEGLPARSLASKLAEVMPTIDQRIREGVAHEEIVRALNEHGNLGVELKLTTFRTYLARYRRTVARARKTGQRAIAVDFSPPGWKLPPEAEAALDELRRMFARKMAEDALSGKWKTSETRPLPPTPEEHLPREASAPGPAATTKADLRRLRAEEVDLDELARHAKEK